MVNIYIIVSEIWEWQRVSKKDDDSVTEYGRDTYHEMIIMELALQILL